MSNITNNIVDRMHNKRELQTRYMKNRHKLSSLLNNKYPNQSVFVEHCMTTIDEYIEENITRLKADFTKDQLSWLNDKVDIRKLHYSSRKEHKIASKIRFNNKLNQFILGTLAAGFCILIVGSILWSFIQPATRSAFEKCKANETLSFDDYCKEDGTVGNKLDERRASELSACNANGPQWQYFGDKCNRIAYNTKQECIDAGLQGSVTGEHGEFAGMRECQDDGTTRFTSEDSLIQREIQDNCKIKGNISYNSGEKIYHVPGDPYYEETVVNESYGERWFCSEQGAQAAGWRRAASY